MAGGLSPSSFLGWVGSVPHSLPPHCACPTPGSAAPFIGIASTFSLLRGLVDPILSSSPLCPGTPSRDRVTHLLPSFSLVLTGIEFLAFWTYFQSVTGFAYIWDSKSCQKNPPLRALLLLTQYGIAFFAFKDSFALRHYFSIYIGIGLVKLVERCPPNLFFRPLLPGDDRSLPSVVHCLAAPHLCSRLRDGDPTRLRNSVLSCVGLWSDR